MLNKIPDKISTLTEYPSALRALPVEQKPRCRSAQFSGEMATGERIPINERSDSGVPGFGLRVWFVAVIVPFIMNIYGATCVQAASKQKSETAWAVEQRSEKEGLLQLVIADSALKLSLPKQNLVVVARAPSWNVVTINKKENLGIEMALDKFVLGGYRIFGKEKGSVVKSRKAAVWHRQPAELLVTRVTQSDPLKEKLEMLYQDSEGRYAELKNEEFLFEKWMNLRPEIRYILSGLYRVNKANGLLLERTSIYVNGKRHVLLRTISCSRVPVAASQFEYPRGFKTVRKIRELTMEDRKREQAASVLEDMFIDN